jgi:hypothetical protein
METITTATSLTKESPCSRPSTAAASASMISHQQSGIHRRDWSNSLDEEGVDMSQHPASQGRWARQP